MLTCIICGDIGDFENDVADTNTRRFQQVCDAFSVNVSTIEGWSFGQGTVPFCPSCCQISDSLSSIVDQLKTLEAEYLATTLDLKRLVAEAEAKTTEEEVKSGVNNFRKQVLGINKPKRGRGRPKKSPISHKNSAIIRIANVLSESEHSHAEDSPCVRKSSRKRKTTKDPKPSAVNDAVSDVKLTVVEVPQQTQIKEELHSETEPAAEFEGYCSFEVESADEIKPPNLYDNESSDNNIPPKKTRPTRRSVQKRKSALKKQLGSETDEVTDRDPDFSFEIENKSKKTKTKRAIKNVKFNLSESDDGNIESEDNYSSEECSGDEKPKSSNRKWKKDKKSGKMWYDGVEVFTVDTGLECSICHDVITFHKSGKNWQNRLKMKDHILIKHLGNFVCPICNKKLSRQKYLDQHVKIVHEKALTVLCDVCEKPFTSTNAMKRHRWSHQNEEEKQAALAAGKKQYDNGDGKLKIMQCGKCGKMCRGPYNLKKHEEIHVDEKERTKHMCQICGAIYKAAETLRSHIKLRHENNNQLQWLQCPHCPKKYPQPALLDKHLRSHTGEKPYVCEQCGKAFVQRNLLNVHHLKHQNIRPHQCPHCEMAFYRSYHLRRHIQAYHENPNPPTKKQPYRSENGTRKTPQKREKRLPQAPSAVSTGTKKHRKAQVVEEIVSGDNDNDTTNSGEQAPPATHVNVADHRQFIGLQLLGVGGDAPNYNFNMNTNNPVDSSVSYSYPITYSFNSSNHNQ